MEILKDLFDEKVLEIINIFLDHPEKQYSLTDISNLSRVNVATSSRILAKLINKQFIKSIVIGKIRIYQLEKNEKTFALTKLLRVDNNPLQIFVHELSQHPRIKKIVLESRKPKEAKVLLVGDFLPISKIKSLCEKIKKENNFDIKFVEISENQYESLKNFESYNLENKILWKKSERFSSDK